MSLPALCHTQKFPLLAKSVFALHTDRGVVCIRSLISALLKRINRMPWDLPIPPWFPIYLSLKVAGLATLVALISGLAVARFQMRRKSFFSKVLDALCTLPMILPPTVLGYYLILVVGRRGILGEWLADMNIEVIFTWQGAVIAATVVVFPLIYKSARAALESVDPRYEDAARTLGASEAKIFFLVTLPLAWRGILAGSMLAFARGMGEFGATLMIAGNIPGRTQTLALAIYDAFQAGDDPKALSLVLLTSFICLSILIAADSFLSARIGGGKRSRSRAKKTQTEASK